MRLNLPVRDGYIFLVSILAIGAIAAAASLSLMLLGWAAEQNGRTIEQSARAMEYAHICAERALAELQANAAYDGDEMIDIDGDSCEILTVGGSGNDDRTLCVLGESGNSVRRFEIRIDELLPSVIIDDWREVPTFSLCS